MTPTPSSVVSALPASGIRRMMAKARAMDRLLGERHVAPAPGEAFGEQGKGRVRPSLASSEDQVKRGACELADFCREQGGR